ncbi:hypothetical protein [Streptomyces sp. URMC 129]|uniref:hypothetical protein n=1 Tax=Streptomyces sp. URMC 129 TaxID=3423407 RepID=UPI003F19A80B
MIGADGVPFEVLLGLACRYCHRPFRTARCSPVEAGTITSSRIYARPWQFRVLACGICVPPMSRQPGTFVGEQSPEELNEMTQSGVRRTMSVGSQRKEARR